MTDIKEIFEKWLGRLEFSGGYICNLELNDIEVLKSSILQKEQELENRIQELSKRGVKCCDDNLEIANELEISQEENQKLKKEIERLVNILHIKELNSLIKGEI